MTNEVQLFTNEIFGEVRAVNIDGKAWFVGKDVAEALGYQGKGANNAVKNHCKGVIEMVTPTNGGQQTLKYINEYDVIRLIMKSKLPQAQEFERWVVEEVIPSVLSTGEYKIQEKEKSQAELAKDSIFGLVYNQIESVDKRLEAIQYVADYSKLVGKGELCDNGTITIPGVKKIVLKHYGDILMENNIFLTEQFIEFHRFLAYKQFLEGKRFRRKDGIGIEKKATYQPANLFYTNFVDNGYAQVREIDTRGKLEITYTKDIEKYIVSTSFKRDFFKYLGVELNELQIA